ncbi:MAG: HAMP domain-containing protein [Leptospira sp.]|nr:HAMP domain-containing protein [Leptospira sp.]
MPRRFFKIKNEELRYYLRDFVVFSLSFAIGIFLAEFFYFSGKEELSFTSKIDSYVVFILPFFVLSVILSYAYRNRRNFETGKIRSSIRYRLTLAFLFVSLLPSIPIFILSSNLTGKLMETFYRIDITNALNSAHDMIQGIEEKDREDIINKSKKLKKWMISRNPTQEDFINQAFQLGMEDYNIYYMGLFNMDNEPILETQNLKTKIRPDFFTDYQDTKIPVYSLYRNEKSYFLAKLDWKANGYILIGKRIHIKNSANVFNILEVRNSYEALNLWKEKIPSGVRLAIGIFSIVMFGFSIFFSFLFARKISRPIIRLANATQLVSSGETNISLDSKEEGEMGILIESFNQMVKDLKSKNEELMHIQRVAAWKEVAQRMAHEIKNPLTPIQLSAERIRKRFETNTNPEKLKEVITDATETIVGQVRVLEHLVKEFSEFARMPVPTLVNQPLNPIIEESVRLFKESTEIEFEMKLANHLPEVYIDRRLFLGVINNLIKNAVEAINEREINQGRKIIRIETKLKKRVVQRVVSITIEDSGDGLPVDLRKKIFEPYYSTKSNHGSGIGLAIVQKTVIDHHGHITVNESTLGGCAFIIELPSVNLGGKI